MNQISKDIYSISRLTHEVRTVLESGFPLLWIEGEISNLAIPTSGHWYFSLKDEKAQIRCAMFRNKNRLVTVTPENGKKILIRARVSLYEARGEFQCIVEHLEDSGEGQLQRAYLQLKDKLNNEGLFDPENKLNIPTICNQIGIITSPTGAAIHDILNTLNRRYPAQNVIIYPVLVQGVKAAAQIKHALQVAQQRDECDCLILTRGGGSLEDLWPFNEEIVARAISDCKIPIVSAIGHEVDVTISDFVADFRAATPTAAAEFLSPDQTTIIKNLNKIETQLIRSVKRLIFQRNDKIKLYHSQLVHPGHYLQNISQKLDELNFKINTIFNQKFNDNNTKINELKNRLQIQQPSHKLETLMTKHKNLQSRLKTSWLKIYLIKKHKINLTAKTLNSVSPLATLNRGYAIVKPLNSSKIIRTYIEVNKGDQIKITLNKGILTCNVKETNNH